MIMMPSWDSASEMEDPTGDRNNAFKNILTQNSVAIVPKVWMETSSSLFMVAWLGAVFRQEAFLHLLLWDSLLQSVAVSATVTCFSGSWGISKLSGPGSLLDLSWDHQLHLNQPLKVRSFPHWRWWENPDSFQWVQYRKLKPRNTGKEAFQCCYVQKKLMCCFPFISVAVQLTK